jgi:ribose transport system ATP-binding protein
MAKITPDEVVRMMVGREIGDLYPPKSKTRGTTILEVRGLQLHRRAPANTFSLYQGEVLGFAGLIGSGRSELARAIFGADPKTDGEIVLEGKALRIRSPQDAIRCGLGYVPEDRKAAGLFLNMAIKLNIEASNLRAVTSGAFIAPAKERQLAQNYVSRLDVAMSSIDQEVRLLSGGNQQKVLLAKWLAINPRVLIVDEPTRGIDVGAKREIHFLLRALADQGVGVIMISSELPEVLGLSDRVLVMRGGQIAGELSAAEASEERIMRLASHGIEAE